MIAQFISATSKWTIRSRTFSLIDWPLCIINELENLVLDLNGLLSRHFLEGLHDHSSNDYGLMFLGKNVRHTRQDIDLGLFIGLCPTIICIPNSLGCITSRDWRTFLR